MSEVCKSIRPLSDLNRADANTIKADELSCLIDDLFTFHPWDDEKIAKGNAVKVHLKEAYKAVILNVPSSPTRTRALNAITDARMLVNQALTFDGRI